MSKVSSRMVFAVALLLASTTLVACSDSESETATPDQATTTAAPSTSGGGPNDACSLLKKEEAASALGGPVSDAKSGLVGSGQQASDTCRYELLSDVTTAVQLTILHDSGQVELFRTQAGDTTTVDKKIPGLGEDAFCTKAVLGIAVLSVLKGNNVLQLTGATCGPLESAAKAAVPRLS